MMDEQEEPEVTLPSVSIPGEAPGLPAGLEPVEDWSEIDEGYEPIPEVDDEDEDEVDEDLTDEEIEPPEEVADIVLYWATYELHGRNLDAGTAWQLLASEPYDGTFEVEVEGLTAGARWEFRIRLIDHNGRASRYSDPLQIHLPTDFTPPPAPLPPFVDENLGFVTLSTTGELTGETPEDMSHLVLYVQQMHPQDDPEGEPGDPQRMTTFPGAGSWSISTLLAHVRYRAFLTAVDTTGNESPWSELIEFIPSVAFDVSELEDQLEHLNEERLPALEQSISDAAAQAASDLQDFRDQWEEEWDPEAIDDLRARQHGLEGDLASGLQNAFSEAEALAEAARGNAVAQAAAAAQTEYERLQELAERALSRAGDNVLEDPSFETNHWLDFWANDNSNLVASHTSVARTGQRGVEIQALAAGTRARLGTFDVEPDETYRFTVWYCTQGSPNLGAGSGTRLQLRNGTEVLGESDVFQNVGAEWTRAVVNLTIPEGMTELNALLFATNTTGALIIDDAALQEVGAAGEALRQAEVARQEAQAAHLEAGSARDLAADAYASASGKSTVHWSLSAPSGTGVHGDVWWRYEVARGRRVVIGEWHWDNGWQPADIAVQRVPNIDIGSGTFGDLAGSRIQINSVDADRVVINNTLKARHVDMVDFTSNQGFIDRAFVSLIQGKMANFDQALIGGVLLKEGSIGAQHLTVGVGADMILDQKFNTTWWRSSLPLSAVKRDSAVKGPDALNITPARISAAGGQFSLFTQRFEAIPGAQYVVTFDSNRNNPNAGGANDTYRVWARAMTKTGGWVRSLFSATNYRSANGWRSESFTFTVPDDSEIQLWEIEWRIQELDGGNLWIANPSIQRMAEGRLIVQGLLQATTAELQELFFDTAVGNAISLGIANVLEINADRIRSNSWTGQTLTGPVMQSHDGGQRGWRIQPTWGLEMWDGNGNRTIHLDGANNHLSGTLHAGINTSFGVELDYQMIEIDDDRIGDDDNDGDEREDTYLRAVPFMRFWTDHAHRQVPRIWVGALGNLNLNPGKVGNLGQAQTPFRVWGEARANVMSASSFFVRTRNPAWNGGLIRDGERTQLAGRAPGYSLPRQMFTTGFLGPYRASSGNYRGSMTWSTPSVAGSRAPHLSSFMSTVSIDNWRHAVATAGDRSASGFRFTLNTPNHSNVQAWLYYNAVWE